MLDPVSGSGHYWEGEGARWTRRSSPSVLLPHPLKFNYLWEETQELDKSVEEVGRERREVAGP